MHATGSAPPHSSAWKWVVCGLLLLATMMNYMDRITFNLMSDRIMRALRLDEQHYGQLESAFAYAFALGAIVAGWMADRWNVRWIYPAAVLAWSAAGFATGLVNGFVGLLLCRFMLGLAEAGNWPCALRTTQHILPPAERTFGNSILQSGAALGAILTPPIVLGLLALWGDWRYPFMVVGALGGAWVFLWLAIVRRADLTVARLPPSPSLVRVLLWLVLLLGVDLAVHLRPDALSSLGEGLKGMVGSLREGAEELGIPATAFPVFVKGLVTLLGIAGVFAWLWRVTADDDRLPRGLFIQRTCVLALLVISINAAWHYFRVWLPLFLQRQHGYSEEVTYWFTMAYYIAADVGSLTAGFVALTLARKGLAVHTSRVLVFLICALVTMLSVAAARLPPGPLLLGLLLVIGFAALGLFPNYYSFSQELTIRHQGKVTGSLGCICWLAMSLLHEVVGDSIKATGSYSQGVALAGLAPLVGVVVLLLFWGGKRPATSGVI